MYKTQGLEADWHQRGSTDGGWELRCIFLSRSLFPVQHFAHISTGWGAGKKVEGRGGGRRTLFLNFVLTIFKGGFCTVASEPSSIRRLFIASWVLERITGAQDSCRKKGMSSFPPFRRFTRGYFRFTRDCLFITWLFSFRGYFCLYVVIFARGYFRLWLFLLRVWLVT